MGEPDSPNSCELGGPAVMIPLPGCAFVYSFWFFPEGSVFWGFFSEGTMLIYLLWVLFSLSLAAAGRFVLSVVVLQQTTVYIS